MVESNKSDKPHSLERSQASKLDGFADRIDQALAGRTMKWLADRTGISTSMLSEYRKGKTPGADKALAIAQVLDVNLGWLLTGSGERPSSLANGAQLADRQLAYRAREPERDDELVPVVVSDVAYGMGGAFVDETSAETSIERFPRSFIRQFTKGPINRLYFAIGVGDSMEPTIHSSDLVLIDRSQEMLRVSDQIWAVAAGQVSMVKRVRVLPDGSVLLVSDKPGVSDYAVGQDELQLIGRVVAVVKKV